MFFVLRRIGIRTVGIFVADPSIWPVNYNLTSCVFGDLSCAIDRFALRIKNVTGPVGARPHNSPLAAARNNVTIFVADISPFA